MHNFEKQFVDVPIVSVQSNIIGEREWLMSARRNEASKVFACTFVIREMAEEYKQEDDENTTEIVLKLSFMYHYVMNFRSKYTRELKTNLRKRLISAEDHEHGISHIQSISFALKEAKSVLDKNQV